MSDQNTLEICFNNVFKKVVQQGSEPWKAVQVAGEILNLNIATLLEIQHEKEENKNENKENLNTTLMLETKNENILVGQDELNEKTPKNVNFKCYQCNKLFLNHVTLKRHIKRIHDKKKNFFCEFCDKKYFSRSEVNQHIYFKHR